MTPEKAPTYISRLTPPGQAALATFGVFGSRAWEIVRVLFRRSSGEELPDAPSAGRFWFGRIGGEIADEVVVSVKQTEPIPLVEVHAHGGREVARFLVDLFCAQGAQVCSWKDYVRRTEADPLSAEAAIALAQATTLRTASILLDQHRGALRNALADIVVAIDNGDSGIAEGMLDRLLRYASVGEHLTKPWRVVVAGAPNVGKSSLVNALAGYQRSIVAATPGTTRDVVTTSIALDGWTIALADTAGLRSEADALEAEGIDRARTTMADADLCLWILDATSPPAWPSEVPSSVLFVVNKIDLAPVWPIEGEVIPISARTGQGLNELCDAVVSRLVPDPPPPGAPVPFAPHLSASISSAQRSLAAGEIEAGKMQIAALMRTQASIVLDLSLR